MTFPFMKTPAKLTAAGILLGHQNLGNFKEFGCLTDSLRCFGILWDSSTFEKFWRGNLVREGTTDTGISKNPKASYYRLYRSMQNFEDSLGFFEILRLLTRSGEEIFVVGGRTDGGISKNPKASYYRLQFSMHNFWDFMGFFEILRR